MEAVINKADLLGILKENRATHNAVFLEAVEGYKKALEIEAQRIIEEVKSGKTMPHMKTLPVPVDQTKDYDRVIRLLELDTRSEIELAENEVAQYVMDDWSWKRAFAASNVNYTRSEIANTYYSNN